MSFVPVILFTTSHSDVRDAQRCLKKIEEMVVDRDYQFHVSDTQAEAAIVSNEPQLLVLGLIHGNHANTRDFARRMKEKNPLLKVASFIPAPTADPVYDLLIRRLKGSNATTYLLPEMHKFLEEVRFRPE